MGEGAPHRRVFAAAPPDQLVHGGYEPLVAVLDVDVDAHVVVGEGLEDAAQGRDLAVVVILVVPAPLVHQPGLGFDGDALSYLG